MVKLLIPCILALSLLVISLGLDQKAEQDAENSKLMLEKKENNVLRKTCEALKKENKVKKNNKKKRPSKRRKAKDKSSKIKKKNGGRKKGKTGNRRKGKKNNVRRKNGKRGVQKGKKEKTGKGKGKKTGKDKKKGTKRNKGNKGKGKKSNRRRENEKSGVKKGKKGKTGKEKGKKKVKENKIKTKRNRKTKARNGNTKGKTEPKTEKLKIKQRKKKIKKSKSREKKKINTLNRIRNKRRKLKKKKGEKSGNKPRQNRDSCQNISCLNNLLQVLKIDKDTVQNFIRKKKRIDKRLDLAGNKGNKSADMDKSMELLAESLGRNTAVQENAPICAGRYNESKAMEGLKMYRNMSKCDKLIKEACDFKLSGDESTEVEKCNRVMGEFRKGADACKNSSTNCTCWNALAKDVQAVKACNIAKAKEFVIKKKLELCKNTFQACKAYEDKSIAYIATCKTSSNALKTILKALFQSLEKLNKVQNKNEKIINSAARTRTARAGKSYTTTVTLIESITTFTTMASSMDVDQIGTNDQLKQFSKNIAITTIIDMKFTTVQISTATANSIILTSIRIKIVTRIAEVKSMLSAMTLSTVSPIAILIETLEPDTEEDAVTNPVTTVTTSTSSSLTPARRAHWAGNVRERGVFRGQFFI